MNVMYLRDGYSGKGRGLTGWYRSLTVREAKRLGYGSTLYAVDKRGCVRECRVIGAPKTWKTRSGCELSLKYGLKEHFRVGRDHLRDEESISQGGQVWVVVPVKQQFVENTPAEIVFDYVLENELTFART